MSSAIFTLRAVRFSTAVVLVICVSAGAWFFVTWRRLLTLRGPHGKPPAEAVEWRAALEGQHSDWSAFAGWRTGSSIRTGAGLAERFRLAGTMCWTVPDTEQNVRKAIIDDLNTKEEHIVAEGGKMGQVDVVSILDESVLLRESGHEERLFLSYRSIGGGQAGTGGGTGLGAGATVTAVTNAYGVRLGENRWVMNRSALMGYVREMENNPARLAQLFDAMVPVYERDANGNPVTGESGRPVILAHRLEGEGEREFYEAVGLKQGDVVNKVNGMPITSKGRAMFWINQFQRERANTFMLEVVRNGKAEQIEYLVR